MRKDGETSKTKIGLFSVMPSSDFCFVAGKVCGALGKQGFG
jgi:hypothetical protein